ncbi:pseudouridine-5'-phosphate glycosidase [Cydia pomonella]|uniref:pseudouridine-5'-phosphate glycosidase n=1 Tax=Cydia pomonella TaxID=82600 RepID=UPI002ADD728C|nr:pseudouridine-5'-phosphate glycosidase [Cydia pomonella]
MYLRRSIMSVNRAGHGLRRLASKALVYSEEVLHAKTAGSPIVALESTIITHGMPYPQNLETAVAVETIIREKGAVPATVAILKGQLTVGLTREQLEYLARAEGVVKASRRDLAPVAAAGLDGATTVAGTLVAADLADIPVFVTGGIGGVHREGENTLDVSADLTELGRSRAAVVCSGVKSILDIGKTLEYLETQGVCVCAFGESDAFPAFYTRRSGHRAPHRTPTAAHAARLLAAARKLCLASGTIIAVPVPEEYAMDESVINEAITLALQEAKRKGIHGKEVTPYILAAVSEATGGKSLDTNMALIKNNAKVGADIAVEFNRLKNVDNLANNFSNGFSRGVDNPAGSQSFHTSCRSRGSAPLSPNEPAASEPVLVIGGANVDRTYRVAEDCIKLDGSTHPCAMAQCGGGVARNMAEALWRLRGGRARLLTAVGDDADGHYLTRIAPGLLLDGCMVRGARTPTYAAIMDARGECQLGLGDMALHNHISIELVNRHMDVLEKAPVVVLDGNAPQSTIKYVIQHCSEINKPESSRRNSNVTAKL